MYNKICEVLKDKIIEKIDNSYSILLYSGDLATITQLNLNNSNISEINGIEKFTALTDLNISNNNISNIQSLSSLSSLNKLSAYGNSITDLSPISNLNGLQYLNVSKNKLTDSTYDSENTITKKISSLTNLTELDLSHNYLRYTNGLVTLTKLTNLNLYDNAIRDLTGLSPLVNLTKLNLGENNENNTSTINGLNSLNNLTILKYLDFSENQIAEIINYITNLVNLETLSLQGNRITDISKLSNLTKLKVLNLYSNSIQTIPSGLFQLVNLEELILGKNDLRQITELCINNNGTYSLAWNNLKKIDLSSNRFIYSSYAGEQSTRVNENSKVIEVLKSRVSELNYEYLTDTSSLPHYDQAGTAYVTYDDFGAKCDGVYDDFIAIRNAHNYANNYGYEVRATTGKTYHIFKYYESGADVLTSVDWQNATFIIHDEEIEWVSGRFENILSFSNNRDVTTINNPSWT
ncbi:MAG: leucine-rich repeat domain-containing protein, partial [Bacilli bacterium]|nr:leucine-rich repeat domain-containing protein [Bacilli bacterium]